ncbi:amidase [Hyphomonas sp. WL0036]|nr:amidase [Hyphomonas sediminis]
MAATDSIDLSTAGALEIGNAVRAGQISALEATDAAIARIEALDGRVNAVVVRDFDRARDAAKAIDAARSAGDARPFLGVPMTVKESNDVAGLASTWGFEMFKDMKVAHDGAVVERLKAQGAIILGKTNVPVALADWQAENPVYGRTVNPFDAGRSPGGSSGGAAAALATGMVPLEIGSDIGGSIRIPAHFCGVFGHKPTYGIVPSRGHGFPGTDGVDAPLAVVGPMARNVADLAACLDVIAGPEAGSGYQLALPAPRQGSLGGYRVRVIRAMPDVPVDRDTGAALDAISAALKAAGASVTEGTEGMPDLAGMMPAYIRMLNTVTSRGRPDAAPITAHDWMALQDYQLSVTRAWARFFAETDILISPSFSTPAFPHKEEPDWSKRTLEVDGAALPYGGQLAWAAIATFAGLPSTVAPVARSAGGLPIGVQLIGAPYGDRTTLHFASLLEAAGLTV